MMLLPLRAGVDPTADCPTPRAKAAILARENACQLIPPVEEVMMTLTGSSPSVVRMVVPHWAPVRTANDICRCEWWLR